MKNLRRMMLHGLKGALKAGRSMALLGCSWKDSVKYREGLFWPGMSWSNYGKNGWEDDHIVPLASFDLSDPKQQKIAFHYTNLQPLWKDDNLQKRHRLDWEVSESEHELPERLKRYDKTYWKVIL